MAEAIQTGEAVADGRGIRATYRVQFNSDFTFADAERLADYLAALGVSHLYASPIFEARAGSAHGYDMVDPTRISAELGGEAGFRSMAATLAGVGIGIVLDIVPNHMAADAANPYWTDVLEFGADAGAAAVFDIDFSRPIALPWLSEGGAAIEALHFEAAAGRVMAEIAGNRVPLRPASVAGLLDRIGAIEAAAAWRALDSQPAAEQTEAAREALRRAVAASPESFGRAMAGADRDAIHAAQHWRAVPWRQSDALNYRRFFEVSHLIGVRIEDDAVFDMVHRLPLALVNEGLVQGLRVDHIDGLADPAGYAARLRAAAGVNTLILVEKILGHDEDLRPWPIDGTTGYERLNLINEAFVSGDGRRALHAHLESEGLLTGEAEARIFAAKAEVIARSFKPELARLVASAIDLVGDDAPPSAVEAATIALLAAFPVYRSYIAALPAEPADEALWWEAERRVAIHQPDSTALAERLVEAALQRPDTTADRFRLMFQQLSSPAMAKGFEDTELYRSVALASINEVGADLVAPTRDIAALHAAFARLGARGLNALATHDTKRGADTRARLNVLSHHAQDWIDLVATWRRRHAGWTRDGAPDGLDEWFIYQTLFGAWPLALDRARGYFEKAMREAKRHTSWSDPAEPYEAALQDFVATLIEGDDGAAFREEIEAFIARTARTASINSLGQTVLQLTLPGIPDLYRGTELADFSLVDPDNRRPVDWERRAALLQDGSVAMSVDGDLGAAKLAITKALLALRGRERVLFAAPYEPLPTGSHGWLGFTRRTRMTELLVAVPLTPTAASDGSIDFRDRTLDGAWHSWEGGVTTIADGRLALGASFPIVVLQRAAGTA